ncbi:MAG: ABC transporter permease subunit [Actinomycetota bacterium]|nr:ABC transporter permease subunit [Actinomycetota bacterium]
MTDKIKQYASTAIFIILLFGALFVVLQKQLHFGGVADLPTEVSNLPAYAFYSFSRMLAAYILAFIFSIVYGMTAALKRRADKVMLPILDVLQSVPVLGFFPAAVFFFVNLMNGSRIGVEMASVFLIFTSQAWNMTFGVYESLTTMPKDVRDAGNVYRLNGVERFKRLLMPACTSKLVYNSILSWAGGWYFLVATEIITIGSVNLRLPGLGSFLMRTAQRGETGLTLLGLAVLIFIIVVMDVMLWRPLTVWSQKFRYEFAAAVVTQRYHRSILLRLFLRVRSLKPVSRTFHGAFMLFKSPGALIAGLTASVTGSIRGNIVFRTARPYGRRFFWTVFAILFAYLIYLAARALVSVFSTPIPAQAYQIPGALAASGLRLLVAYIIALAWTIPVAVKIGHSPRAARVLTPVFEIVASVPATAIFPLMAVFIVTYTGSLNLVAVLLVLTGMQWYLLFNLLAGVTAIPNDMKEVAKIHQLRGWLYWRRVVLPAIFPSIVTGSVTAWGGGWNALIIAEYFKFQGKTFSVFGIGAFLDKAMFSTGNSQLIVLALVAMVGVIAIINRFFWRRLYNEAARRFTIEY